ncbi:MAG TPA: oxygenase MpaB family protein [Bryobacteraceae bacterium]|nr:oxygenase MpaB family protein [Bryobacteraceae bacterium]
MRTPILSSPCFRFTDTARQRYGDRADQYLTYLFRTDPLADAAVAALAEIPGGRGHHLIDTALNQGIEAAPEAPSALHELFSQLDETPSWVDWDQLDLGGAVLLRSGLLGVLTLALGSLPLCYGSPAGNKPLAFSGQLIKRATRRLGESGRYVYLTSQPGALRRFGEGFKANVKVRLMHAQIRRLLWQSGRWNADQWGEPINQAYLAATNLMFSAALLEGMRNFGLRFTPDESEALMQLWRYAGHISGVTPELLCGAETEARRMLELVFALDGPPDEDSRALINALMLVTHTLGGKKADWMTQIFYGISYGLIGEERASALGYPRTWRRWIVPSLRPMISAVDFIRSLTPGGRRLMDAFGARGWELVTEQMLAGPHPDFRLMERLATHPSAA